ncbi:Gfo/Idh/MocA family protein [Catenulispora rubra]|uniref:Gfo/Idh/MocA family protein n=1 Tax=Catenulispora rubra TaxID=280293 RepID=UPI0018921807|nr:Gfo/Idh/MocA family oxidoreductase [Catenulispora rubra]
MAKQLKVGIIGAGGIAGLHGESYAQMPEAVRVTGVSDINPAAAEALSDKLGATPYEDYHAMLAADVDAVDICLPHHLHADAAIAAARAGKHILCEKPLCTTPEEAARVREAVADAGVTLMCAHNQLFLPSVVTAKQIIAAGELGDIYEVRTNDAFRTSMTAESAGWRASSATSGGGELIDTGYHPSYLLVHLAGGRPAQVTAMLANHRLGFLDAEDSAQVLVRFDNGVIGNIATSWAYQPPSDTERFSVFGSNGSLRGGAEWLSLETVDGGSRDRRFPAVDTFTAEIEHFVHCLATGERPIHTEVEGSVVLDLIMAAYRAADGGGVVAL